MSGDGTFGQLGVGDNVMRLTPTLVRLSLSSVSVVDVAAGASHAIALGGPFPPSPKEYLFVYFSERLKRIFPLFFT